MFQSLRGGAPFYILYKGERKLSIGEVESVGEPVPQYGTTYQNGMPMLPKNLVEVKVRVDGELVKFKVPADLSIADSGSEGMVVSESREAIINEIESFKGAAVRALNDVPKNEQIVKACDSMLAVLNPQIAREAQQARDIEGLKAEVSGLRDMITNDMSAIIKEAVAKALKGGSK